MKICGKCREQKKLSAFSKNRKRKDGLQSECKSCRSIYLKEHYQKNKSLYIKSAKLGRQNLITWYREKKNKPCVDCGIQYPYYVMDFDHRDPSKKAFLVSKLARSGRRRKLEKELLKCDLVCSNCHRERTHTQNSPRSSAG